MTAAWPIVRVPGCSDAAVPSAVATVPGNHHHRVRYVTATANASFVTVPKIISGTTMPAWNCNAMATGCVDPVAGETPRNPRRIAPAASVVTRGGDSHHGQPRRVASFYRSPVGITVAASTISTTVRSGARVR